MHGIDLGSARGKPPLTQIGDEYKDQQENEIVFGSLTEGKEEAEYWRQVRSDSFCKSSVSQDSLLTLLQVRQKVVLVYGNTVRIFSRLRISDMMYNMLLLYGYTCTLDSPEKRLLLNMMKAEMVFWMFKVGMNVFCTSLIQVMMVGGNYLLGEKLKLHYNQLFEYYDQRIDYSAYPSFNRPIDVVGIAGQILNTLGRADPQDLIRHSHLVSSVDASC